MSTADWVPDQAIITAQGLFCKCGHLPFDHQDEGCLYEGCRCIASRHDLTPKPAGSSAAKILPDGRLATLYREIFGFRILIGPADDMTGGDEYLQYRFDEYSADRMLRAFQDWDGYGYIERWFRRKWGDKPIEHNDDPRIIS